MDQTGLTMVFWGPKYLFSGGVYRKIRQQVFDSFPFTQTQGGITCGAIDEPRKSSKAIDERVIINFRDKNFVIATKMSIDSFSVLSIDFLFYRKLFCSIHSFSVL